MTRAAGPEDVDPLTVPAGTWVVIEYSGPFPQALQYPWRDVFTQWFPSSPYGAGPGPEILRTRPEAAPAHVPEDAEAIAAREPAQGVSIKQAMKSGQGHRAQSNPEKRFPHRINPVVPSLA